MIPSPPRIVSLLPSATEILHALGLGEYQVGRSHECDWPPEIATLPVCTKTTIDTEASSAAIDKVVKQRLSAATSIYQLEIETLRALRPTHVLTQTLCDVCAVSFTDVQAAFAQETRLAAQIVALGAASLHGVWADIQNVAKAIGALGEGDELVTRLQQRIETIRARASGAAIRPSIAAIEWLDPLMAAGNWVPELIALAGGRNLFGQAGEHSPWMEWEELRKADPDILVALPCGFNLQRTRSEMTALTRRPGWNDLRAVQVGRVYVCDGNQFMNRPGPRLVESLQIFAEICQPDLFPQQLEGIGWQRLR